MAVSRLNYGNHPVMIHENGRQVDDADAVSTTAPIAVDQQQNLCTRAAPIKKNRTYAPVQGSLGQ